MTICLAVTGRHVERLNFLDVMLGDEPPLSPPEIFYPHTLAGDPVEEVDRAEKLLKAQPLSSYYDDVALGGLKRAQNDLARGSLDPTRIEKMRESITELVDDLAEDDDWLPLQDGTNGPDLTSAVRKKAPLRCGEAADEWRAEERVLCIAGRSGLDESVALMLAQLLEKHGLSARVEGPEALSSSGTFRVETEGVRIVCLSYLDTNSTAHMRYAIRRLRKRLPDAKVILGCWTASGDTANLKEMVKADIIITSLRDTVKLCLDAANHSGDGSSAWSPSPRPITGQSQPVHRRPLR